MASILEKLVGHKKNIKKLVFAAEQNRLAPTYIFSGPEGIGKRQVALGLLQVLVCEAKFGSMACGSCPSCARVENEQSENLITVDTDSAQIKIDQIREVIRFLSLKDLGKSRMIIINQAHLLNPQAANSLLKSLEEPPPKTHFVLVVPGSSSLLPTIRSRSQIINFKPLTVEEMKPVMAASEWMYKSSMGSFDALASLMSEEVASVRQSSFSVWEQLLDNNFEAASRTALELAKDKQQSLMAVKFWQQMLRDAVICRESSHRVIHQDYLELIERMNSQFSNSLIKLESDVAQLEGNILGHLDRGLAFQNYFYTVRDRAV